MLLLLARIMVEHSTVRKILRHQWHEWTLAHSEPFWSELPIQPRG